jgi:ABC-type transport system involved in multi-copper enzyme maturation permease subunit
MSRGAPLLLAAESARDALRRRFALAVALVLAFGLASANSCTGLGAELSWNDRRLDPVVVGGFLAPLLFSLQSLAVLVVAGVLASDHLARPLGDGSAALWLARPVSRGAFAGARLAGVLAVSLGAGALLLGGTGALLLARHGVAAGPGFVAAGASALGAAVVAALAMAASLVVGRAAVLLGVVLGVPLQMLANAVALAVALVNPQLPVPSPFDAIDRFGPPLGTAVFAAASAWNPHVQAVGLIAPSLARLALWGAGAVVLLVLAFRRVEVAR